jgi:hypothetical protein
MSTALGMDAVGWIRKGLVDILIPTSTWKPTDTDIPIEEWRKSIGENTPTYILAAGADLHLQGMPGGSLMKDTLESQCGFTVAMLHRGADCIYLFNHFNPQDFQSKFRDMFLVTGDLARAQSSSRRHVVTFRDTNAPGITNPKPLPFRIDADHSATYRMYLGPKPKSGEITIRIGLKEDEGLWDTRLVAQANGEPCEPIADLNKPGQFVPHTGGGYRYKDSVAHIAHRIVQFDVSLADLQSGYNTFEIGHGEGAPQTLTWFEVYMVP